MGDKQKNGAELRKELDSAKELVDDYTNQLKRLQAEFENYTKRVEKERVTFISQANEKLIVKLLTLVDDFERVLAGLNELPADTRNGIEMLYKHLLKVLEEENVAPFTSKGQQFDPYKHEVVLQEKSTEAEGTVLEEFQKGYTMNGNVIRYAKVKISKGDTQ